LMASANAMYTPVQQKLGLRVWAATQQQARGLSSISACKWPRQMNSTTVTCHPTTPTSHLFLLLVLLRLTSYPHVYDGTLPLPARKQSWPRCCRLRGHPSDKQSHWSVWRNAQPDAPLAHSACSSTAQRGLSTWNALGSGSRRLVLGVQGAAIIAQLDAYTITPAASGIAHP
jgi:hypothetical protein